MILNIKKNKHIYITESQKKIIENFNWKEEFFNKNCKNGYIKIYHNTTINNLDNIIVDNKIVVNQPHKEGHGNMIWFTILPNDYNSEAQISLTISENEFKKNFKLMNSIHCISYHDIDINQYNFKIEKIDGYEYDRIIEIFKSNDSKLLEILLNKFPDSIYYWFLEKSLKQEKLNESIKIYFTDPQKVLYVKKYLDTNFVRASSEKLDDNGYPKTIKLVGMIDNEGKVIRNMSANDLFYLLQDRFQKIYLDKEKRDKFLKHVMKEWYEKRIDLNGLTSKNTY